MKDHDKEKRKGQFQHKLFKFIVLIIVAAFFCLIFSFIYIEFFGSKRSNEASSAYFEEKNLKRYDYLKQNDIKFYFSYNRTIPPCDTEGFYYSHISRALPCIINYYTASEEHKEYVNKAKQLYKSSNLSSNTLGMLPLVNNFLDYTDMRIYNAYNHLSKGAYVDDKAKCYLQIHGVSDYSLAPITIINEINHVKNETYKQFNTIYSNTDLSTKEGALILSGKLNEGDMLYVPSYFFIQSNWDSNSEFNLVRIEYSSASRLLSNLFAILFDDKQIEESDIEDY